MKLRPDVTHGENKTCTKPVARSGVQPQQTLLDFGRAGTVLANTRHGQGNQAMGSPPAPGTVSDTQLVEMSPSHRPAMGAGSGAGCCPPARGGCGTSHRVTAGAEKPVTHTRTHSYTRKATVTLRPLSEENKQREDRQRKRGQNPTLTSPAGLSAKRLRQGPAPDRCPARRTAGEGASIIPSGPYGCPQCHRGSAPRGAARQAVC